MTTSRNIKVRISFMLTGLTKNIVRKFQKNLSRAEHVGNTNLDKPHCNHIYNFWDNNPIIKGYI